MVETLLTSALNLLEFSCVLAFMPNIDKFFEGLDHKVRNIHNPDFQDIKIRPSTLNIYSRHWIITVSVRKDTLSLQAGVFFVDLAQVSGTSTSAEKAYALPF